MNLVRKRKLRLSFFAVRTYPIAKGELKMEIQKVKDLMTRLMDLNDKVDLLARLMNILGGNHPLVVQMLKDLIVERDTIDDEFKGVCLEQTNIMNGTSLNS
jgi:hypothetical protein